MEFHKQDEDPISLYSHEPSNSSTTTTTSRASSIMTVSRSSEMSDSYHMPFTAGDHHYLHKLIDDLTIIDDLCSTFESESESSSYGNTL